MHAAMTIADITTTPFPICDGGVSCCCQNLTVVLCHCRLHRKKPEKHAQWLDALKALREITGLSVDEDTT